MLVAILVLVTAGFATAQSIYNERVLRAIGLDDDEVVTVWVDPVDEASPPVIDGVSTDLLNSGGGKILTVSIRGDQMNGQPAFFDNLRVGLSFAEVTPWALFADGFESGNTDLWSSVTP